MKKLEALPPMEVANLETEVPTWIACAATRGCPGNQAELALNFNTIGVGRTYRYICLTCGMPFHVQPGGGFK